MIVIRQKEYSEGKNTKKVRKETDKKDKLVHTATGAAVGAAEGGLIGSILGNPGAGAAIGAGIGGAKGYLNDHKEEVKRKSLKESKKPTKPKELDETQPSTLGTAIGAGFAGYAGKVTAENLHARRSLKKADKALDKIKEKAAKGMTTESELNALNALYGKSAETAKWVLNKTKKHRKVAGAVGASIAAGSVIGSVAYNKHKADKLKKAYEKDKKKK